MRCDTDEPSFTVLLSVISIHAPTWGATTHDPAHFPEAYISIHAPTWGATTLMVATTVTDIHFNPRTYVRCDVKSLYPDATYQIISIHAPTWGATPSLGNLDFLSFLFQSTHLREVRQLLTGTSCSVNKFQSTHLREVRPNGNNLSAVLWDFNPRTYVRCDRNI